jgi:NitT/TauT family transport system substrate-binding protein
MVAHVGLDPGKDIDWVRSPAGESIRLFIEGKVDAYPASPDPQELRAKKIGRVIVNSARDRPWSQYFCCLLIGNREFVRKHPVATKARDARDPQGDRDWCSRARADGAHGGGQGLAKNYDYTLQAIKDLPYARWREFDPEDTVRFYALRLREAGMIKSTPQKIPAEVRTGGSSPAQEGAEA